MAKEKEKTPVKPVSGQLESVELNPFQTPNFVQQQTGGSGGTRKSIPLSDLTPGTLSPMPDKRTAIRATLRLSSPA